MYAGVPARPCVSPAGRGEFAPLHLRVGPVAVTGVSACGMYGCASARASPKSPTRARLVIDKHVLGLEVAVYEAGGMCGGEAATCTDQHRDRLAPAARLRGEP